MPQGKPGDETLYVQKNSARDFQSTTLELRVSRDDGQQIIFPCSQSVIHLGHGPDKDIVWESHPPVDLTFGLIHGKLGFRKHPSEVAVLYGGRPAVEGELEPGEILELPGGQILFWDRSAPAIFLQGCSAPYAGRIWPLPEGQKMRVGRGSPVENAINLEHPTVSRKQATFEVSTQGAKLVNESSANPVYLNGEKMETDSPRELKDSDLLEFGTLLFRFFGRTHAIGAPKLFVESFGPFRVRVGDKPLNNSDFTGKLKKWLMARLAFSWKGATGSDELVEILWPESSPDSAHARLNGLISTLRRILKEESQCPEAEYLLRSTGSVQLNEQLLGSHDVIDFLEALQNFRHYRTLGDRQQQFREIQRAFQLYQFPFLNDCELDWALETRNFLEQTLINEARTLLTSLNEHQEWQSTLELAVPLRRLDPGCQLTCLEMMRAHRGLGNANEAVRIYSTNERWLKRELGVEPDIVLMREFYEVRSLTELS